MSEADEVLVLCSEYHGAGCRKWYPERLANCPHCGQRNPLRAPTGDELYALVLQIAQREALRTLAAIPSLRMRERSAEGKAMLEFTVPTASGVVRAFVWRVQREQDRVYLIFSRGAEAPAELAALCPWDRLGGQAIALAIWRAVSLSPAQGEEAGRKWLAWAACCSD